MTASKATPGPDEEAMARAIALADSREYILATSDSSELGHANDSGWRDFLPHARAALALARGDAT